MESVNGEAAACSGGPFLGILIGMPLSLAVWAMAVAVALVALR